MAVRPERPFKEKPPLSDEGLERMALHYVGRYATTRAKLATYLNRKMKERGWAGAEADPVPRIVERFAQLGYVDDKEFAVARAAALGRRGYGARRVGMALKAAGIDEEDAAPAREAADAEAWTSALRFAERRRIGPFAVAPPERPAREKAFAAMMRAGHSPALARRIVSAEPGQIPELDEG